MDKEKHQIVINKLILALQGLTTDDVSQLLGYTLNEALVSFYKQAKNKGTAKAFVEEYFKAQHKIFQESVKKLEDNECRIILN
jgi:hypothetical protein